VDEIVLDLPGGVAAEHAIKVNAQDRLRHVCRTVSSSRDGVASATAVAANRREPPTTMRADRMPSRSRAFGHRNRRRALAAPYDPRFPVKRIRLQRTDAQPEWCIA
jgi:hypothetical protein